MKPSRLPLVLLAGLPLAPAAPGQDRAPATLSVQGGLPVGGRSSVTEANGVVEVVVTNTTGEDRDARVAIFYALQPDIQYARDVWVPARSALTTWVPVGPAPPGPSASTSRELKFLLYDRAGGQGRQVAATGADRLRGRGVNYRRREPTTAVLADTEDEANPLTGPPALLARAARHAIGLATEVSVVRSLPLPPTPDALAGVDVLAVAGNRLAADPPGRAAVRRWVLAGGTLWVMLDRTDPATVAAVLGDDADLAVAGRTGLTHFAVGRAAGQVEAERREVEQPVAFARVVPGPADQVVHVVDGWPASFVRRVGRGKVVFTTLGPAGWFRPRVDLGPAGPAGPGRPPTRGGDGSSPDPHTPDFPVPLPPLQELAGELHPPPEPDPFPADVFRPLLTDAVGYSIVGPGTAAAVFAGCLVAAVGLALLVRRSSRPELAGWLAAGAAVLAGGIFVGLGERTRQAVPPTAAAAALVDVVPGSGEAVATGLYAVFHPSSGEADIGTRTGAELGLDAEGLEGQPRRRVQVDTDVWAWDDLGLPAGLRVAPFRSARPAGKLKATVRFGPIGLEGRFDPGPYTDVTDALVVTPAREPITLRLAADGAFTAGPSDTLPAGQYLAATVLSSTRQRRQEIYRQLLAGPMPRHLRNRDLLLAWAAPPGLPVEPDQGARVFGTALLAVPLEFDRTPAGTRVVVPRAFVRVRRLYDGKLDPVPAGSNLPADLRLRFEVPPSVRPLAVDRATVTLRLHAVGRPVKVSGVADGRLVPLWEGVGPVEPIRLDLSDPRLLKADADGALYLNVSIGPAEGTTDPWKIDALGLELAGTTG